LRFRATFLRSFAPIATLAPDAPREKRALRAAVETSLQNPEGVFRHAKRKRNTDFAGLFVFNSLASFSFRAAKRTISHL
jgi:hypothetical protein